MSFGRLAVISGLVALGCSSRLPAQVDEEPKPKAALLAQAPTETAPIASAPTQTAAPAGRDARSLGSTCNEQAPQEFLVRAHMNRAPISRKDVKESLQRRAQSIAYRTQHYGYYRGFGLPTDNPTSPLKNSETTAFFDIPVVLNRAIIPALKCVEAQLRKECREHAYQPRILSGLRRKNTYFDGDASNHVYGIAIDIDPLDNPCCGCVKPWSSNERCRGHRTSFERMRMPQCWVTVFERFGFYWLGHDVLEDTMHFEFLGDPDRIVTH